MLKTRHIAALAGALALAGVSGAASATEIRFSLDWKLQGVHAWYYLAEEKGYFAEEGLEVTIDQGEGSAATVTRILSGAYDAGFGDMNAIIQNAAARPGEAPVMVYQIYNNPPFAVLTTADGPIATLSDLEGRAVAAPPGSASTKLFPALAEAAGFDASKVEQLSIAPNLQEQMLIQGQVQGALVFNVTAYINLLGQGRDPDGDFRWFPYGEAGLDIYSNGVMVSRSSGRKTRRRWRASCAPNHSAPCRTPCADPTRARRSCFARVEAAPRPRSNRRGRRPRLCRIGEPCIVSPERCELGIGDLRHRSPAPASIDTIVSIYELPMTPGAAEVYHTAEFPARRLEERRSAFRTHGTDSGGPPCRVWRAAPSHPPERASARASRSRL